MEVKKLYELMRANKDGWWYITGEFTIEMFSGLLIYHEGAGKEVYIELVAIAGGQQLYVGGWNPPYCTSSVCENGMFNFWAAYSQSTHVLIDMYVRGGHDISEYTGYGNTGQTMPYRVIEKAKEYGKAMLHPSSLNLDRYDALSNYGCYLYDMVTDLLKANLKPYVDYATFFL